MSAQEKAKELVSRMKSNEIIAINNTKGKMVYPYISGVIGNKVMEHQAKQYALICVQEIILSNPQSNPFNTSGRSTMGYWEDVKREIEKL